MGSPARTTVDPAIRIDGLTKRFGRIVAVRDLSMAVAPGEVFGFLGPNGAGNVAISIAAESGVPDGRRRSRAVTEAIVPAGLHGSRTSKHYLKMT